MRKKIIIGNWKMNGSKADNVALIASIQKAWANIQAQTPVCDVAVCVPSPYLEQICTTASESKGLVAIKIGAQDVSAHVKGAYTGEVSGAMLTEFGVALVIVGHSERRQHHAETDGVVAAKAAAALAVGITPIVCVGESLAQREAGTTEAVVLSQLDAVADALGDKLGRIVLAYEPVWAIGTGKTATAAQAQAVHAALRSALAKRGAAHVTIVYGGSMNAANAADLLAQADIDGGLIGGASLKGAEFAAIVAAAS